MYFVQNITVMPKAVSYVCLLTIDIKLGLTDVDKRHSESSQPKSKASLQFESVSQKCGVLLIVLNSIFGR